MSILNKIDDIKIGNKNVKYVYLGHTYVWPVGEMFWTFDKTPSTVNLTVGLSGNNYNSIIFWGDQTYDRVLNNQQKSHTYT
jgi:hypothetical protein